MTASTHLRLLACAGLACALATGCLVGDPNPYDVTSDTPPGTGGTTDGGELPVSAGVARGDGRSTITPGAECTTESVTPVSVQFQNGYPNEALRLFWVDRSCNEIEYALIPAGTMYSQSTYQGHPWRLRSGRGLLHEYVPTGEPSQMVPLP